MDSCHVALLPSRRVSSDSRKFFHLDCVAPLDRQVEQGMLAELLLILSTHEFQFPVHFMLEKDFCPALRVQYSYDFLRWMEWRVE